MGTRLAEARVVPSRFRSVRAAARPLRIGLLGYGRIGQAVAGAIARPEAGSCPSMVCTAALVRHPDRPRSGPRLRLVDDAALVLAGADIVVEVLGGCEPAYSIVAAALDAGIPVVTANKSLLARHGPALETRAHRTGTPLAFDAAVLAGVPFLGALARRPHLASARAITGVLNGTSHFILDAIARGADADRALAEAVARGFAEPDATADTSGQDAAEKLAILLRLCGRPVEVDTLARAAIDDVTTADCAGAALFSGTIKPVAHASLAGEMPACWVGPALVPAGSILGRLTGVDNAVCLASDRGSLVSFVGPGAGPEVTARTILDDITEIAGGLGAPQAPTASTAPLIVGLPSGGWFVRVTADRPVPARHVADRFAGSGVPVDRLVVHAGCTFVRTGAVEWTAIQTVTRALGASGARVFVAPAVE